MRAWSAAILTQSPHGTQMTSVFTLAPTHAEAIASGVRTALGRHENCCRAQVTSALAIEIDPDVIIAAADELRSAQPQEDAF